MPYTYTTTLAHTLTLTPTRLAPTPTLLRTEIELTCTPLG